MWGKKKKKKTRCDREAQISGRSGHRGGFPPRGSGRSSGASAQQDPSLQAPPATRDLPDSHLTCPVPAGRAGTSGPLPRPGPSSHPIPSRHVSWDQRPGQHGQGSMPAPPPQAQPPDSLSESASAPWVKEGSGDTGRRGAAAWLGGVGRRGLRSLAARLAQPCGSPARRSLARSGSRCLIRVRPSASVRECAGGDAGETLLFPLLLLGRSLRPPHRAPPRLAHWEL